MTNEELQERGRKLIDREVYCTLSHIVATVAKGMGERVPDDLANLAEQAYELASPVRDWEEAATGAGWSKTEEGDFWKWADPTDASGEKIVTDSIDATAPDGWERLCEEYDIEPYEWEVFEHWIVSDWLGEKLTAKGEKVDTDFGGLTVWARTTTGQAIYIDGVIEQIVADLATSK